MIRGRALDSSGLAHRGLRRVGRGRCPISLNVGNDGLFELPEVPAGPFTATLRVSSGGFTLYGSASGEVVPGAVTDLTLQVQPSGTVTGAVLRPDGTTPAYGALVTVRLTSGPLVNVQAQADGRFTARGVPLGALTVTASDPITAGLAVARGLSLATNGQVLDIGTLVLDASPPVLTPVEPAPGSVRATFGGPLVLDVSDAGGVDPSSLAIVQPYLGNAAPFVLAAGRATSTLRPDAVVVGENRYVAQVKDLSGNLTTTEWRFTVTGGILRGTVLRADGAAASGAPLSLDHVAQAAGGRRRGVRVHGPAPGAPHGRGHRPRDRPRRLAVPDPRRRRGPHPRRAAAPARLRAHRGNGATRRRHPGARRDRVAPLPTRLGLDAAPTAASTSAPSPSATTRSRPPPPTEIEARAR